MCFEREKTAFFALEESSGGKFAKTRNRKICSSDGCTNFAQKGGACNRHGTKKKKCSSDGCTNQSVKGGVCVKHGAKVEAKRCSSEGCTNQSIKGKVMKSGLQRRSVRET